MASKTPDTIIRESMGSLTLLMCQFSTTNIDNDDTYATGLGSNLVDCWFNCTLTDTAAKDVHPSNSSGTITFSTGEDNITGTLYLLART
jgi:hypothetical protein